MTKGSFTQFVKGETAHRFAKVAALAISSCMLVAMIAVDASASSNGITSAIAGQPTHLYAFTSEASLSQLFGFGRNQRLPVSSATSTSVTSTASTAPSSGGGAGGAGGGGTTTTTSTNTTTAPPTTTTTAPSTPVSSSGGLITAGPSRSECIEPNNVTGLSSIESTVSSFDSETSSHVTCLDVFTLGAQAWSDWEAPWIDAPQYGLTSWVAQAPQTRQLVIAVSLIPASLSNINNPLSWEQSCASGDYDSYATQLGTNLVAAGLQNSVIRLGDEMNGPWEEDYVGSTTQEQNLWASCFANEVTAMRAAAGSNFLFDWDINACTQSIPYANYYPGNAYVDILGLDLYDQGCDQPNTALSFSQLANEPYGLTSFEAFAAAQGKPMSLPEWGLASSPAGDDPAYIDGIANTVAHGDFAFQAYFEVTGGGNNMPLSSSSPLSNAAYQRTFGS
jgi:beta-mannanase